jgi:hypothetical protein
MSFDNVQPTEYRTLVVARAATVELSRVVWVGRQDERVESPAVLFESGLDIVVSVKQQGFLRRL